jgi:hypothetical protein
VAAFVFSDWQPYTAHVQTSLDRLLVQTVPLALLLLVEVTSALTAERATTTARVSTPARHAALRATARRATQPRVWQPRRARHGGTVIREATSGPGTRT